MSRIDKRTTKIKFDYVQKNLEECYRHLCATHKREVSEMMENTNKHNKTITVHSVMALCKYFGLIFTADFANETITVITHEGGGSPIEVVKEVEIVEEKKLPVEGEVFKDVTTNNSTEEEEDDDPFS